MEGAHTACSVWAAGLHDCCEAAGSCEEAAVREKKLVRVRRSCASTSSFLAAASSAAVVELALRRVEGSQELLYK